MTLEGRGLSGVMLTRILKSFHKIVWLCAIINQIILLGIICISCEAHCLKQMFRYSRSTLC